MTIEAFAFFSFDRPGCVTSPVHLASRWATIIDAGEEGIELQDANNIKNPDSEIGSDKRLLLRESRANILRVRIVYDKDVEASEVIEPKVVLFGRMTQDATEIWQAIQSLDGSRRVTLDVDLDKDVVNGAYKHTTPGRLKHAWNCEGYDTLVLGVEVAAQLHTDSGPDPFVQGRFYSEW